MKIICMFPYFVSCLDVESTLWNSGKNDYSHLFIKSNKILQEKINNFNKPIIEIL